MQVVDFNSDMGEGFGPWTIGDGVDNELMGYISTANIATGFHAGDPGTMRRTVERAKALGVAVGAHPGFRDLVGFGRRHINAPAQELVDDMLYQLGALREIARAQGVRLQHIKPHGALYMHLARDEEAARLLVENLRVIEPELLLYCMPGSVICRIAQALGQPVVREFYADREYDLSGSIVFTRHVRGHEPNAVARACCGHASKAWCARSRGRTWPSNSIPSACTVTPPALSTWSRPRAGRWTRPVLWCARHAESVRHPSGTSRSPCILFSPAFL